MKTGFILIDFDVIFQRQSSEYIKSLNIGVICKNCKICFFFNNFSFKNKFLYMKKYILNVR